MRREICTSATAGPRSPSLRIARDYQVMSIPTMTVFQGGKPVMSIIGAKPKGAILSDLADYI